MAKRKKKTTGSGAAKPNPRTSGNPVKAEETAAAVKNSAAQAAPVVQETPAAEAAPMAPEAQNTPQAPAAQTAPGAQDAPTATTAQATAAAQAPPQPSGPAKTNIFREKSLERIESPEKLNDYLRVTSAGVWIVLTTVILLLIGVCIWGVLGRIDSTSPAAVVSQNGETVCLVPASALEGVVEYRTVNVDGKHYELTPSVLEPEAISETTDVYILLAGQLSAGDVVYPVSMSEQLPEGIYQGRVVTETLSPMSLFFN